jgi:2-polyprenyl-3-methyl-5-hydroxy-6-metoxy-1,4-benzoquinol methylase
MISAPFWITIMLSIEKITTNLEHDKRGFWVSKNQSDISYPDHGNRHYIKIEDTSFWFRHRNNCIVSAMHQYPPSGSIFDIGGGNGIVSHAIKSAGMSPIILEPGLDGALNAQSRGLCPIIVSTLQDAGFIPESIHAAGLFDVLEHIENDVSFLKDVEKLLYPGGRVFLTVPAYNILHSNEDDEAGHFRRYTKRTLSRCVKAAGLEVEYASYFFAILPLPIFLFRTLPSYFSRTQQNSNQRDRSEHAPPPHIFGKLLDALFTCETWLISKRMSIPFGGSCMLVARKPRHK